MAGDELIIMPAVRATQSASGRFVLTQKYLEGTDAIARHWPGPVTTLIEMANETSTDFDHVEADPEIYVSAIETRPDTVEGVMARLSKAAAVLGFLHRRDAPLAPLCKAAGVPMVYITEYTPRTEAQIIDAGTSNPFLRFRRRLWLRTTDRMRRAAVAEAVGLQCSGVPVYEYYADLQPNRLLFFDNRLEAEDMLTEADCEVKLADLQTGRPLRLIYGGRFVPMKGVMDLPDVAKALKAKGVAFGLDIYGDGPLKGELQAKIERLGLTEEVRICAPVDFRSGWVRTLKEDMDLFVCCHPQGDPSSTYPEVMSCGVPIVGYDNEAFKGVVDHSGVGWQVPSGDPQAVGAKIAELAGDRARIAEAARAGLGFARDTLFETTFKARADHLIAASRLA